MTDEQEFDLLPDPRILPMLGEINLAQWRCLAELVDNSVDGFLSLARAGQPVIDPEVQVSVPMQDDPSSRVAVSDNGPGMTIERLEKAVRAGWSGNNPVDSLGMFGMGFNIATARLGMSTTVWTSRKGDAEEFGLKIDFDELRKQGHFRTPRLTRPKLNLSKSGTSVTIERLKPDQRTWFSKPGNRASIKQELAKSYSSMLRSNGSPISFKLLLNGKRIPASNHCTWDESRSADTQRCGSVHAIQKIDRKLPDRPFCTACWQWLSAIDTVCGGCGVGTNIIQRRRHVHGWIGLQRYLSATEFGFDFIRNGRKIEIGNRDLFVWRDQNSGAIEIEYPIDDVRQRGRFVGEIHLDHCRVTYMKDRFDRTDPAWDEMVGIVRGEGPLQPQKAAGLGFTNNESPLFALYQAFRRSSPPKARVAGGWANTLVVKDNDRAEEMAKKFYDDVPEFQTDIKWWELVEEEDRNLLTPAGPPSTGAANTGSQAIPGFGTAAVAPAAPAPAAVAVPAATPPRRTPILSLSREYRHDASSLRWDVRAFDVDSADPNLPRPSVPWVLSRNADGTSQFLVNLAHGVFRSATMTALDALLCELANKMADFSRSQSGAPSFTEYLCDLRDQYGGASKLDATALLNSAEMLFRSISRAWAHDVAAADCNRLFAELSADEQQIVQHKMAARSISNPQIVIAEGRFLEFSSPRIVRRFVLSHPDLFLDGKCWEDSYADLDYMHPSATQEARQRVVENYDSLLGDAVWLTEQDPTDLENAPRERVLRAMLALELLVPVENEIRATA